MLPDEVREAMERMCTPLDESRLSGVTAQEDARCMALIRAHLLAREAEVERLQAELGDYRTNGASAVRFAPNSAHWSNELKRLFGEDARTGIGVLEKWHCDSQARAERAEALLRECLTPGLNEISLCSRMRNRITAHLSENSRG